MNDKGDNFITPGWVHGQRFPEWIGEPRFQGHTAPPPFPTFADGHLKIRFCEAVLQCHREQRWVKPEE